jgi:uncharacterized protein (DUF433 family)
MITKEKVKKEFDRLSETDLEREDLLACLEYAAQLSRTKKSQKVVR